MRIFLVAIISFGILAANAQTLQLPARNPAAINGTQVISLLTPLSLTAREDSIFSQVVQGNVPDFLRNLILVTDTEIIASSPVVVSYYVLPDYLALGCDSDYFLCPMTPLLAQRIANYTNTCMPTRKMVNQIWQQAPCKLAPQTISPSPQMTTVPVFADHNTMVWTSRSTQLATHPLGTLTGGDKKDVIISNQIYGHPAPGRVVIYGWHQLNGSPIQPLYYGHEESYADYSHGIRLVQNDILVNGSMATIQDVLASASQSVLLSDEGVIAVPYYPFSAPSLSRPESFCVLDENNTAIRVVAKYDPMVTGYNVMLSRNGTLFEPPVYYTGNDFQIAGLVPDTLYYLKISARGTAGNNSPYSEVLAATTFGGGTLVSPWLLVNGFDRVVTGNTYDFVRQHASAIFNCTLQPFFSISSATNEAVCDSLVFPEDYMALDYILGEESSVNETFSGEEQVILASYLDSNKPLFVSGSEIGWDLDHLGSVSDKAFYHNYMQAVYVEDAPDNLASTYYDFTLQHNGQQYYFDNGTQGTYNVRYPDVVDVSGSSASAFPLGYYSPFPAKYSGVALSGSLVYLAVPFETIYPESARQELFDWVVQQLFVIETAEDTEDGLILVYPNPSSGVVNVRVPFDDLSAGEFILTDMSGRSIPFFSDRVYDSLYRLEIKQKGFFILTVKQSKRIMSVAVIVTGVRE